ncbi:hypothetical protein [Paenibacillus lutrae]|nr:hypothetical protein [Paenibacillus lutrae]
MIIVVELFIYYLASIQLHGVSIPLFTSPDSEELKTVRIEQDYSQFKR